jgi:hypothetical protein
LAATAAAAAAGSAAAAAPPAAAAVPSSLAGSGALRLPPPPPPAAAAPSRAFAGAFGFGHACVCARFDSRPSLVLLASRARLRPAPHFGVIARRERRG